jgi:glycosyltransferase involved in cell wall biosynthesis
MSRQPVLLAWQLSNLFGWGVVGMNIFRQWAGAGDVEPLMAVPADPASFPETGPAEADRLRAAIAHSNALAGPLAAAMNQVEARADMPVVHALGNALKPNFPVWGRRNLGRTVFENTAATGALDRYDLLLAISAWNGELLRARSRRPAHVILEAVDHQVFQPGPRRGLMPKGRFHIFTGGKIEFRKGQDLVLLAFREFSRRHDDAVLVTAWQNPWPERSAGFQGRLIAPLKMANEKLDLARWSTENGIAPGRVIHLHRMPNHLLANYIREMDCALQPSRAEAGTNMVAMEAMACGVPVIVGRNTGMTDLIADGNCVTLNRQTPVIHPHGWGTEGWGESDVAEIVAALEELYADREKRDRIGAAGAAFMQTRTWAAHADALKVLALG